MVDERISNTIYIQISSLQQQNQGLRNQLNQYRESILQICKCSGFSSWYNFTQWVFRYFKETPLSQINVKNNIDDNQIRSINRLFNENKNLTLIQQEQFQSTISQKSLQNTLRNLTNKFISNEDQDWRNQTLNFQKIKKDVSTVEFSQIQQIVLQNVQLRKQISILRKQTQSTKQSLCILANMLRIQRKQISQTNFDGNIIIFEQKE